MVHFVFFFAKDGRWRLYDANTGMTAHADMTAPEGAVTERGHGNERPVMGASGCLLNRI